MLYKGRLFSFIALLMNANVPSIQFIQGLNSKCNISPVGNGDNAAIICSFGEDIGKLRREFQIIHYGKDHKETTVLICLWHFENPECIINKKYKFRGNITDTVQVDIDKSTEEYTGDYVCNDLSTEPGNYESCKFSREESKSTAVPVSHSTLTTMVIKGPDGLEGSSEMNITKDIILVVLAVLLLLLIIAIGIFIYKKKSSKKRKRDSSKPEDIPLKTLSTENQSDCQEESNHGDKMPTEDHSVNQEEINHDDKIPTENQSTNQKESNHGDSM